MDNIKIINRAPEVKEAFERQIKKALTECGLVAEGYAKLKCPVDTGRLRSSIEYKVEDKECYIGTNAEYAPYVELGTGSFYAGGSAIKGQKAQSYLKPAVSEHSGEYRQIIIDNLKT